MKFLFVVLFVIAAVLLWLGFGVLVVAVSIVAAVVAAFLALSGVWWLIECAIDGASSLISRSWGALCRGL